MKNNSISKYSQFICVCDHVRLSPILKLTISFIFLLRHILKHFECSISQQKNNQIQNRCKNKTNSIKLKILTSLNHNNSNKSHFCNKRNRNMCPNSWRSWRYL